MTQAFDAFLTDIAREQEIGTILYLGVDLADPAPLLAQPARHVALALPEPMIAPALRRQAGADKRLSLHPVLAGPEPGQARLTLYNFAALSGTRPPDEALRSLFPNLRKARQVDVDTQPLDHIRAALPASEDRVDVMIVDLRGEEPAIAAALQAMAPGDRFAHVILRAGQEALYEGALPLTRLAAQLDDAGYGIAGRSLEDPDIPCVHFRLDPRALRVAELQTTLQQRDAALAERDATLKKREGDLAEATEAQKAAKARIAELTTALEAREGALKQRDAALAERDATLKKREGDLAEATEAQKTAEARIAELTTALNEKETALRKGGVRLTTAESRIAELEQELAEATRRQRAIEDEVIRAEAQIETLCDILKLSGTAQAVAG